MNDNKAEQCVTTVIKFVKQVIKRYPFNWVPREIPLNLDKSYRHKEFNLYVIDLHPHDNDSLYERTRVIYCYQDLYAHWLNSGFNVDLIEADLALIKDAHDELIKSCEEAYSKVKVLDDFDLIHDEDIYNKVEICNTALKSFVESLLLKYPFPLLEGQISISITDLLRNHDHYLIRLNGEWIPLTVDGLIKYWYPFFSDGNIEEIENQVNSINETHIEFLEEVGFIFNNAKRLKSL